MNEMFTKAMARNIFYGGTLFFFLLFLGLTFDTMTVVPTRSNDNVIAKDANGKRTELGAQIVQGKKVWEDNNCVGCHTILGEGAYFAPELGNVYVRFGNSTDAIKAFIMSRPKNGIPGRRSMPQFNLSDADLEAVAQFLKWTSEIDTAGWPPNIKG
ncbi:MAG: cytochrome c [Gammaproteobacteria bacterium]|nr:MAG: cytochrome c [Gammaproteobacteria bacterium]